MDPLAPRVASRFLKQAGWTYLNGEYTDIAYGPTKWVVTEMANGEPIPKTRGFGDAAPEQIVHEMTTLKSFADKSELLHQLVPGPETIRGRANLKADDKGAETRQKILVTYKSFFKAVTESLKEDGRDPHDIATWEKAVPEMERKLVWKKVK